ncbi:hypothetical protein BDV26DRAFT_303910 [Aspergillus bertholletiae]|uniref:Uncharacterized protein n=1 Tax=Aspergillus bertholletiae TaxID=1226010 RepID=A0A5N7BB79_9EURO|nr:hypothetical protein BDV26DRAFT_303910 [Aspergillus bertholletiae]
MESVAASAPRARFHRIQKLYNDLGFKKGYNFILFFIFGGAWMGFTLARLEFLNFSIFCKNTVSLAAAILAFFQFVPAIRYKVILFHRINGYIIILLVLLSNAGTLMIARHTFGGLISTQAAVGLLVIITTCALGMAYYNVKRLQLEQHRAWMLRAFFYPCDKIDFIIGKEKTLDRYPDCASFYNGSQPSQNTLVLGDLTGGPDQSGTALNMNFGMALWLAMVLHLVGVEIYLQLTPRESQRLREISYTRQLEAGFKRPGSAGLTVDRFGDSDPWVSGK